MKVRKTSYKPDFSIDSSNITLEETSGYSDSTISYAKQLKATHPGQPDSFYLKYASEYFKLQNSKIDAARSEGKLNGILVKYPQWAAYTYEEIISLSNGGYNVPKEVLEWAYSIQEKDITRYVIEPEDFSTFDSSIANYASSDNDINNIPKNTARLIVQSQKAGLSLENEYKEYDIVLNRALDIKTEKEHSYKQKLEKISNQIKEWKNLDDKRKHGELTEEEKSRFTMLGANLRQSSFEINEFKNENADLKEFLKITNQLSQHSKSGVDIANKTRFAIDNMVKLDKSMPSKKSYDVSDTWSKKIPLESLPEMGYRAIDDLQRINNEISITLNAHDVASVTTFAQGYTAAVDENVSDFEISDIDEDAEPIENIEENILKEDEIPEEELKTESEPKNKKENLKQDELPPLNINETDKETYKIPFDRFTAQNIRNNVIEQNVQVNILDQLQLEQESQSVSVNDTSKVEVINENTKREDKLNNIVNLRDEISDVVNSLDDIELPIFNEETENPKQVVEPEDNKVITQSPQAEIQDVQLAQTQNVLAQERIKEVKTEGSLQLDKLASVSIPSSTDIQNNIEEDDDFTENVQIEKSEENEDVQISENNEDIISEQDTIQNENDENTETPENILPQVITSDNIAHAASAAVNADITKVSSNSDKEEKRLTRFNKDSIIESKKKKRRVTEISSSRGGSLND